jgi:GNAT superfamily N-acetyltransferase
MTDYEIRGFRPGDREAYLELYGTVFGASPTTEWFEWKYGDGNPYVDEPAVFVAVRGDGDGDLVGARSFFALRMAAGGQRRLALQPADAMVHPEHRRRGLFTEMTTAALDHYADGEPAFCFNFPNPKSLPGNLELGWEVVGEAPTHYRVQDPAALSDGLPSPISAGLRAAASAYYRVRTPDAPDALDLAVSRRDAPVESLAGLYRRAGGDGGGEDAAGDGACDRLHALRDETFYGWRLASPGRTYGTYVGERGGEAVAALVVGRDDRAGAPTVRIIDALAVGEPADRREALEALLASALADHRDAALVADRGGLPPAVRRRFGFRSDAAPPLSAVASASTMVARPVGDAGWTVAGRDLREPDNWRLTFAELDSA